MADITLKSSGINSGTAVNLNGVEITYGWNNYVKIPDVPSKFAATDAQVEVDFMGWTNPTISIRGVLDTNNVPTNGLTLALLKSFAEEKTNVIYITEDIFFPVADTNKVQIISFSATRKSDDDINNGRFDYQINLVETL